jgi:hypothetical protein
MSAKGLLSEAPFCKPFAAHGGQPRKDMTSGEITLLKRG